MAKWSEIWDYAGSKREKMTKLIFARNQQPRIARRSGKGEYPHLQPFFKYRPKEKLAA